MSLDGKPLDGYDAARIPSAKERDVMADTDGHIPPHIMELIKKKGWTWPPDEKLKEQWRQAASRFGGSMSMDPEVRKEVVKSFPGRFPDDCEDE
jgi:hypothetical protein